MFIQDLHWPEPEFAAHLEQRLKLMASDMTEACVRRSEVTINTHTRTYSVCVCVCVCVRLCM